MAESPKNGGWGRSGFLTVNGVLLEDTLDVALLLSQLALAGAGGQQLLLEAPAFHLLGVGRAGPCGLVAAVDATPRRAPCETKHV